MPSLFTGFRLVLPVALLANPCTLTWHISLVFTPDQAILTHWAFGWDSISSVRLSNSLWVLPTGYQTRPNSIHLAYECPLMALNSKRLNLSHRQTGIRTRSGYKVELAHLGQFDTLNIIVLVCDNDETSRTIDISSFAISQKHKRNASKDSAIWHQNVKFKSKIYGLSAAGWRKQKRATSSKWSLDVSYSFCNKKRIS